MNIFLRQMLTDNRELPLIDNHELPPPKASMLTVRKCHIETARHFNSLWHSRLPYTQRGPWKVAFSASYRNNVFAVALWHNSSARNLPKEWLELRRLAVAPNAPHCTASYMLAKMTRWIRVNMPDIEKLISYQDKDVHKGTIYKAAGWIPAWETIARVRDRSKFRRGTGRYYRSNSNGAEPNSSGKIRWELAMLKERAK
jgi:hypothetical protein